MIQEVADAMEEEVAEDASLADNSLVHDTLEAVAASVVVEAAETSWEAVAVVATSSSSSSRQAVEAAAADVLDLPTRVLVVRQALAAAGGYG